jgi:hypothetical protein
MHHLVQLLHPQSLKGLKQAYSYKHLGDLLHPPLLLPPHPSVKSLLELQGHRYYHMLPLLHIGLGVPCELYLYLLIPSMTTAEILNGTLPLCRVQVQNLLHLY